jgi:hypothetical protein
MIAASQKSAVDSILPKRVAKPQRDHWRARRDHRAGSRSEHGTESAPSGRPRQPFRHRKTLTLHLLRIRFKIYVPALLRYTLPIKSKSRRGIVKQILGAGLAACAMMAATSAMAADMAFPVVAPIAVYDWSGIYVGGVLGGAWATNDVSDPGLGIFGTGLGVPVIQTTNSSGFIGGVEGGSNYQFGKLVVGWEGDITWGRLKGTSATSFTGPLIAPAALSRTMTVDTNWIATTTSRVGIALHSELVAQDRVRLSRLRHQDGRDQRRDHAGRRGRDPRVVRGAEPAAHQRGQGGHQLALRPEPLVTRIFVRAQHGGPGSPGPFAFQ